MGCNQYERVASGRAFDPPPMVADVLTLWGSLTTGGLQGNQDSILSS